MQLQQYGHTHACVAALCVCVRCAAACRRAMFPPMLRSRKIIAYSAPGGKGERNSSSPADKGADAARRGSERCRQRQQGGPLFLAGLLHLDNAHKLPTIARSRLRQLLAAVVPDLLHEAPVCTLLLELL